MILSDILTRVRTLLNDLTTTYRWSDAELTLWVNDAQKFVVIYRPDSCVLNTVQTLVTGTKQTIPTSGIRLLDVIRNIAADGTTAGRAIRITERDLMDAINPNWHTSTAAQVVKHYMLDERNPRVYYVYPPATAASKVEILCSKNPTAVSALSDVLDVSDIYQQVVIDYVMFRAYSKDAEFSANAQLASGFLQSALATFGVKLQKDVAYSPDLNVRGASPSGSAIQAGGV